MKGRNPEHVAAFKELSDFLTAEVAVRRANPRDDLITHLAEAEIDGDRLSEREIVLTTATFVMAGVESLSSFMSMFALNLHDHPDARRRVVANAALAEQAIEELLRFNTSAQRFKRVVMREATFHGQTMRVGDKVALAFGSGNRDWRKFRDPDVYDIDRRPQGHLGFGIGKHFCLGSQMARLVTGVSMKRFLARVPDYHLVRCQRGLEFVVQLSQSGCASLLNALIKRYLFKSRTRNSGLPARSRSCALQHEHCAPHLSGHRNVNMEL